MVTFGTFRQIARSSNVNFCWSLNTNAAQFLDGPSALYLALTVPHEIVSPQT